MLLGFALGQIRTLQRLGFLANLAVWLNVFVIIMTMAVVPVFGPNEEASFATYKTPKGQPVRTAGYWPEGTDLMDHVNGLMNAVFAYGGATLFNELMAEMRRPIDFWKSLLIADIFIFCGKSDTNPLAFQLSHLLRNRSLHHHRNGRLLLPGSIHLQPGLPRHS